MCQNRTEKDWADRHDHHSQCAFVIGWYVWLSAKTYPHRPHLASSFSSAFLLSLSLPKHLPPPSRSQKAPKCRIKALAGALALRITCLRFMIVECNSIKIRPTHL